MSRFVVPSDMFEEREQVRAVRALASRIIVDQFEWTPGTVGAATSTDSTLTSVLYKALTGLRAGCAVTVTPPSSLPAGLGVTAFVATDNSLTIRLLNVTGSPIVPTSGTWSFVGVIP